MADFNPITEDNLLTRFSNLCVEIETTVMENADRSNANHIKSDLEYMEKLVSSSSQQIFHDPINGTSRDKDTLLNNIKIMLVQIEPYQTSVNQLK